MPYKRVDLAVAACARLGRKVTIVGEGRALGQGAPLRARTPDFSSVSRTTKLGPIRPIPKFFVGPGMTLDKSELRASSEQFSPVRRGGRTSHPA